MTFNEFKAWLEGFEASFTGAPTAAQWKTIKAKLEKVTAPVPAVPASKNVVPSIWPREPLVRYQQPPAMVGGVVLG